MPASDAAAPALDGQGLDRRLADASDTRAAFRAEVRRFHADLLAAFRGGRAVTALVRARAAFVDAVLIRVWRELGLGERLDLALVAVGGYGRGELHPGSDVDLLVLLDGSPATRDDEPLRGFITFLWDIDLEPGHSVRTIRECADAARADVSVVTNLMEARHLAGSEALVERMRREIDRARMWPSREFFEAKRREQEFRHHKFDDTAYNLEPNVKEGPGGLRDIQTVAWVAQRHFGAKTLADLAHHDFLTRGEHETLAAGQEFLWEVRFALHALTGRRENRLVFDHQRDIAEHFGYSDSDHNLAVEQFMKRYYRTIMELGRLNEMLLALFEEAILRDESPQDVVEVNRWFRARNDLLEVADPTLFEREPIALIELFHVLQTTPRLSGVRASTIRLVRDHRHLIDDRFRADARAHAAFMAILRHPTGVSDALRRMHSYGVLGAYLPVFGAVVGQMQYDLFHVYTVDQHSLTVVRNLHAFGDPSRRDEYPLCSARFAELPKPELLYLAGLFHDIAKGRGGDHSELGAHEALEFCRIHGLSAYDARTVAWLVEHHLLMSVTAQRKDIHDPEVVAAFAAQVGDTIHLDYLYLLTVADIRGTSPSLWNSWKDSLLRDLYESTLRMLRRGLEHPLDEAQLVAETMAEARRLLESDALDAGTVDALWGSFGEDYFLRVRAEEIAWHTREICAHGDRDAPLVVVRDGRGGTEIFVYMRDRAFIVAATTSLLHRLGLNILNARIITSDNGMTLDTYAVLEESGERVREPLRVEEIRRRLSSALVSPERSVIPVRRLTRRQLRHFHTPTLVEFFDDANQRTVMEVFTADRPGVLARIAWAIAGCGVRLQNAKIATFGERVEDVFFVTDKHNRPLESKARVTLRERVVEALEDAG